MASRADNAARRIDTPEHLEALRAEVPSVAALQRPNRAARRSPAPLEWLPWQPAVDALVAPVIAASAEHFQVSVADILGRDRSRPVSLARQLSVCLLRARYRWSYPEIARALGINHSGAIHAFRRRWGHAEHAVVFAAYQRGNAERIRWGDHDA